MTERDIQLAIMRDRYRRHVCLPNYTPRRWFECDVFEMTKAGSFREYEIKLTVSDFEADKEKIKRMHRSSIYPDPPVVKETKHDLLSRGDKLGPTQFWYVCPDGLLSESEIPSWAGLIYAKTSSVFNRVAVSEVRLAPRLHSEKALPAVKTHALSVCYWRYHSELMKRKIIQ